MKKRSIPYPSKTLFETKPFVIGIYEGVGDQLELQYDDMAKYGGVSRRETPYFASTASQYGWTESVYGKGHKVNGDICKILRKPQGNEEAEILKKAFISPEVYQSIIKEWNGKQIQSIDALDIYLGRTFSFTDTGSTQCAEVFIENAKALGLIDAENYFRIDAEINISTTTEPKSKKPKTSNENTGKQTKRKGVDTTNIKYTPPPKEEGVKYISVFIKSKELKVPILEVMDNDDWEAYLKQIQLKRNGQ